LGNKTQKLNDGVKLMKQFFGWLLISLLIFSGALMATEENPAEANLVSIHAVDTHLPNLLAMLAKESGFNIVTGPNVNKEERLSIHLDDVPIDQAINLVVRAAGLSYEIVGNSILVAKQTKLREDVGVTPHIVALKYANAEDVAELLFNVTEQITIDRTGNKLLITASPKKIAEISAIVQKVDVPAIQIMLQARLIEVSVAEEEKLGIDWAKLAQISTIVTENATPVGLAENLVSGSLIPGMSYTTDDNGDVVESFQPLPEGDIPYSMYFQRINPEKNQLGFSRQMTAFDVTLDFLLKSNKADILANSQVVTLNGHAATISMVDVVPYILSSGGVGGQVQVQREEVGIKLHILPTVNTDGYITTKIIPEVSSIYDFIGPDRNIPWIKKRISETTVRVKDNETIIIAGLLGADIKYVEHKFPLLWRIPWIGRKVFTHTVEQQNKTDLIIQITPKIIKDNYSGIHKSVLHNQTERVIDSGIDSPVKPEEQK